MSRALTAAALAGLGLAALTIALRDPDQPFAIAMLAVAVALAVGGGAGRILVALAPGGRSARARDGRSRALRRGAGIGAIAGLLVALRAIDGFTPITAGFVVLAFALAELALTTRTASPR